ncbi:hydrophobic surface binding protein A-domain-containing protein [Amanita rubescens]|nr:hydrophobic surface binding protein A-domain-containing protein [Amanita rubescens]
MVKFSSALLVLTTLAISAFASPIEPRDVNKVESDLKQVAHDIVSLNTAVTNVGAMLSLSQALGIKASVENAQKDIGMTTDDVKQITSVSDADAKQIMGEVDNFVPTILNLLKNIDDKKAAFVNLPLPGAMAIMKQDLQNMHKQSTELSDALIALAPATIKAHAIQTKNLVEGAFEKLLNDFNAN